ncbi:MAG: VWA domain-containing protein [Dehalococcoidia bacterium]|nr:VWA domain-containing protein [Dehalococcoidia bacterium]
MLSSPNRLGDPGALVADERALAAFLALAPAARRGSLVENLLAFCGLLRESGIDVTVGRALDAARALSWVDLASREDVRAACAATLLSDVAQRPLFDALFVVFWSLIAPPPAVLPPPASVAGGRTSEGPRITAEQRVVSRSAGTGESRVRPPGQPASYSDAELLASRDFSALRGDDLRQVRHLIQLIAHQLSTAVSRRSRAHRLGDALDLRRSLRRAARSGGELRELARLRRRRRRTDVVLLADVSGSMDVYSEFLVQFVYGLQQELRGVSAFVFSTRLHEVTPMLRARSFGEALRLLEQHVEGWGGGTQIGACLADFNRRFARDRVRANTIVIVMSDGWDRGDGERLKREMGTLARRARRLIWLNPLLGQPGYQPLTMGMAAALPYCDDFMPVHNVESLARFGRHLLAISG